jgi:hypothetical protein
MTRIHWAVVAVVVAAIAVAGVMAFGPFTLTSPEIPESERLAALARIAATAIRTSAPQEGNAHIRLVQALPHDNVVEAEFLVDAATEPLFERSRLTEVKFSVISNMCSSNLRKGFQRGLVIHSVYESAQGLLLADFAVDRTSCAAASKSVPGRGGEAD